MSGQVSEATEQRSWCWWSTHETIQNEVPSVTAILETIIAVPLYWWIALHTGMVLPLLISAVVAPMVLLRTDASVALGLRWFRWFENTSGGEQRFSDLKISEKLITGTIIALVVLGSSAVAVLLVLYMPIDTSVWYGMLESLIAGLLLWFLTYSFLSGLIWAFDRILLYLGVPMYAFFPFRDSFIKWFSTFPAIAGLAVGMSFISSTVRLCSTLAYLRAGLSALPLNFRRIAFCTSPAQIPELVPGLNTTDSQFTFRAAHKELFLKDRRRLIVFALFLPLSILLFVPAWLYRITVKSTAWFWWPLAFLGGDLKRVQNPALFHWQVMGSLWAKTSIALAVLSLGAFIAVNFVFDGTVFERNPLLTPIGYFLLIDWKLQIWQVCALLATGLSILIVYMVNDVSGQYRIAQRTRDDKLLQQAKSNYGWIERLTRFRFLLLLGFWGLVGAHAFLYANSSQEWCPPFPPELWRWMEAIYGNRLPGYNQCLLLP